MDTKKEYQVINLRFEYGAELDGCHYAVASELDEEMLRASYQEELEQYEPFLYLTKEQGDVILKSNQNDAKHRMRAIRTSDAFGYDDGVTEIFHANVAARGLEDVLFEALDQMEFIKIYDNLKERQRRRVWMRVMEGKSLSEIADEEGVSIAAVHYSVTSGLKKLRQLLENT